MESIISGFPTQHVAFISPNGLIDDFTIEGHKNDTFPKLRKTTMSNDICSVDLYHLSPFKWFGFYDRNFFYYVPCNPKLLLIKHDVDKGKSGHITIPNSNIINLHYGGGVMGIHIGNYFWVLGGDIVCGDFFKLDTAFYGMFKDCKKAH